MQQNTDQGIRLHGAKRVSFFIAAGTTILALFTAAGCAAPQSKQNHGAVQGRPVISLVVNQVGETPAKDNLLEQAMEEYTHTELQIQWVPFSAYDEKLKVMIASGELPKLVKLIYTSTIISTLKSGQFWDIGPYLKDYKNLSAVDTRYYDNIRVGGKLYGVPLYRDLGRASIHYRKDWFDRLGLQLPVTIEDWYTVIKALTKDDPDGNGKDDTYGLILEKRYNQGVSSTLTRIVVSQGGPNTWQVTDGTFTPDFMTELFFEALQLFRRLYEEGLLNRDFAIADVTETWKQYEQGRAGITISGGNGQSWQNKLEPIVPDAVIDVAPLAGPGGIRLPGEPGNAGFLAIPKDTVQTEAEMRSILAFLDKLLEPEMQNLLSKGIEQRHWIDRGEYVEIVSRELDSREVKPYRDTLPFLGETNPALKQALQPELFRKNQLIGKQNERYIVPNPAHTLESETYAERGKELEQLITDAETKFIMGKIDELGWKAEIEKWRKAGGDAMIREYEEAYRKKMK